MSDALSIATSDLKSQEFYIDTIANDIANLNTPNYKASTLSFEDVLYRNLGNPSPLESDRPVSNFGLGTAVRQSGKDFSTGPLKPSTNWNTIAINGSGFYQVMYPDGSIAYSRNSNLTIDAEHYLATQDGLRLADNIQIPEEASSITISNTGDVEALVGDESEPQLLGTIQLANFTNPQQLQPLGLGLYAATESSGEALVDTAGSNGLGSILQNQIENSNVDMVSALMQLTMAQRIYQLNAKAVQIADELEQWTNELHR